MKVERKTQTKILGAFLLQVSVFLLCSACVTYELSGDRKYRNYFPVKDNHLFSSEELVKNRFVMDLYHNPDTAGVVQFVFPEDINQIVAKNDRDLLLIFYFPNCSGAGSDVEIARFAEENNISYLLISDTYSPRRMKELYSKFDLKNKNQYIIPTTDRKKKPTLKKRLEFMKEVSPESYIQLKNGLIFATVMHVSTNGSVNVNPIVIGGFRQHDFLIDWISGEFGIRK